MKTGDIVSKLRSGVGEVWGSLIYSGGHCYFTSRRGQTAVFRPAPNNPEIMAINSLNERCDATPAISDGEIFIRTDRALYCISTSN